MARLSQQNKKQTKGSSKQSKSASSGSRTRKPASERATERKNATPLLDDRAKRDIAGVVLILCGIILFVAAVAPAGAIVTDLLSTGLHHVFGAGSYLLPLLLITMGVIVLYRKDHERVSLRVGLGLGLIFVALLGMIALFTPLSEPDGLGCLFYPEALTSHGGYVGAGLAWVGLSLFGQVISVIIMIGIAIIGVVVVGFSISDFIEKVRGAQKPLMSRFARNTSEPTEKRMPFGGMKRGRGPSLPDDYLDQAELPDPTQTAALDGSDQRAVNTGALTSKLTLDGEPKRRRRSQTVVTPVDDTRPLTGLTGTLVPINPVHIQPDVTTQLPPLAEEPPATMTRKLGAKRAKADAAAPKAASKKTPRKAPSTAKPAPSRVGEDGFELPSLSLLAQSDNTHQGSTEAELAAMAQELQETLEDFGVMATVVGWVEGPTVTLFKIDLPSGVRVNKVVGLTDDIALALASPGVRIYAPVPNTNYVGIEVPNKKRQTVLLSDILPAAGDGPLEVCIGKDVEGHPIVSDLAKMPHILIAGTTGSGKSVSVNSMIMTILMRATPSEVRFIMIDPKRVEFTPYNGIPHLYVPVVTEVREASSALSWAVAEMERRLKVFAKVGVRNITTYNEKVQAAQDEAARRAEDDPSEGEAAAEKDDLEEKMPFIVIVIDELADLMMNVGKEVEFSIARLAQLARAAGIHLIIATQRPSTNIVTGLIKANITNRLALNVASGIDSRVILDSTGAENLIGNGDLLLSKPEYPKPVRIQGCWVSDEEINAVIEVLKAQGEPEYHNEILNTNIITLGDSSPSGNGGSSADDPLVWEAADIVVSSNLGSTSNIQRRLSVGYARAGRIMDQLEEKGIVGPANGSRPREVLVDAMELETLRAFEATDES